MPKDDLAIYNQKRDFKITKEPRGKTGKSTRKLKFVVQLHKATLTHYDFRIEWNGVMKSWAVTKGPSFDPADKRLSVRTEDHPISYNSFEGVIPDKQYGAGPVMIWDQGVWLPEYDPVEMEKKGHITFHLEGARMKGQWHLVRLKSKEKRENWLLIKGKDEFALSQTKSAAFLKKADTSIVSGHTMKQIIAGNLEKPVSAKTSRKRKSGTVSLTQLQKLYAGPQLATLVEDAPSGSDWIHEIKYDGYRLLAYVFHGQVALITRNGKDWTSKFTPLAQAVSKLNVESAVLDLEACVLDENGRTSFGLLQAALSDEKPDRIEGWVFDLLHLNGEDLRKEPLIERKQLLKLILRKVKAVLHFSDHFESAPGLLEKACSIGAEGIVSKRKDSRYTATRSRDWVKSKCGREQEFVIGGLMPAKDDPKAVGALLVGHYENGNFLYAGKVGTGFTRKVAKALYARLISLKSENPFPVKPPRGLRPYIFLKPELLCEISFLEWTPDKHIRHGSFKGLREDKRAKDVKAELPEKSVRTSKPRRNKVEEPVISGVRITHPDREIFPGEGITKKDVAEHYAAVAPLMVKLLANRFVSILRCTNGIGGQCFFQRNYADGLGRGISHKVVTHKGEKHDYLYLQDEASIVGLAQMGAIEFHAWQSVLNSLRKPDQITFDLDPDKDVPFEAVKLAAEDVRARLKRDGLTSFARLSGGKGIHIVAPITPETDWETVKTYVRSVAEKMARDAPEAYVANMSKAKRHGKIFIDFFRNDFSATAISPFSLRARNGAAVAWPLSWQDLKKATAADKFKIGKITRTDLKKAEGQVSDFLATRQSLRTSAK